jgi:RNA polymerase sigma factor (sigma-70 family)
MSELNQGDAVLLRGIRRGETEAWEQLIDRYRGRLLAFARSRVKRDADAEDIVQDAFVNFLRGLDSFREEASLETYLFTIVRRRIIDHYRGRKVGVCLLDDLSAGRGEGDEGGACEMPAPDLSASTYVRRDEQADLRRRALSRAIHEMVDAYRQAPDFEELKVIELLFYCHLPNRQIARITGADANRIAGIKHRAVGRVRERVGRELRRQGGAGSDDSPAAWESLLTQVWEAERLSCPKRNTIGSYLLGSLDPDWMSYVEFHLERLGCHYCRANLDDLRARTADGAEAGVRDRILESTVGFLRKA